MTGEFHCAQLVNGSKPATPEILPTQFYQSRADNMRMRLLATLASRITTAKAASEDASTYKQLLSDMELLDPFTWNVDDANIVDGDPAIARLCRQFKLNERTAIDGFRDFFESSSVKVPEKLAPLRRAVECLVVSTAKRERSFSAMNDIASGTRSSLGTKRISALMFAKLVGPKDVIAFNSELHVRK